MLIDAVVADANVLLSAAIGKAALRVFTQYGVEVHATQFNIAEVEKYLPRLAARYQLIEEEVLLHWSVLRVEVHSQEAYASKLEEAKHCLAERDPDDAHPLALARELAFPLWSNDKDLHDLDVPCYSTARLLQALMQERATTSSIS